MYTPFKSFRSVVTLLSELIVLQNTCEVLVALLDLMVVRFLRWCRRRGRLLTLHAECRVVLSGAVCIPFLYKRLARTCMHRGILVPAPHRGTVEDVGVECRDGGSEAFAIGNIALGFSVPDSGGLVPIVMSGGTACTRLWRVR